MRYLIVLPQTDITFQQELRSWVSDQPGARASQHAFEEKVRAYDPDEHGVSRARVECRTVEEVQERQFDGKVFVLDDDGTVSCMKDQCPREQDRQSNRRRSLVSILD